MLLQLRTLMLPLAMLVGFLFSGFLSKLAPVMPYLIFVMLFITFCRITPRQMHFSGMHWWLVAIQIAGCIGVYYLLRPLGETLAQGVMVCILAPTATSAVVIGGMLGANLATMATFTLVSNVAVAIGAPIIFSFIGSHADMPFLDSFMLILLRVGPVLVVPFVAAFILIKTAPKVIAAIGRIQMLSFYLWAFSLMIVTGQTVEFVAAQPSEDYNLEIVIAALAFVVCVIQFMTGRAIGKRWSDTIAGGQSLGQKNTVLAIWMAQIYLDPIASVGPASYVLWQNIVNSWQLWRKARLENRHHDKTEHP